MSATVRDQIQLADVLALAGRGFHVFPITAGQKAPPLIKDFPTKATRDKAQIERWWAKWPDANVGISTSAFGDDGGALLVIDVDNKGAKSGGESLFRLQLENDDLPDTCSQATPTNGRHLVYSVPVGVKTGVDVLGTGLDTRSQGGYIVAAPSVIANGRYSMDSRPVCPAPQWLIDCVGAAAPKDRKAKETVPGVDHAQAIKKAVDYLTNRAPESIKGAGGDSTAYKVVCQVKDFGVPKHEVIHLLYNHWFEGSGWSEDKLQRKIDHAYTYGQDAVGAKNPAADFAVLPPEVEAVVAATSGPTEDEAAEGDGLIESLNREFALVVSGGQHHILWETHSNRGQFALEHLAETAFHKLRSSVRVQVGGKMLPLTKIWIDHHARRTYRGLCFMPGQPAPEGWYNLWHGLTIEPLAHPDEASEGDRRALDMFLEHARDNVCGGQEHLYKWLIGFLAHLVQRPWEKPQVALVFSGGKGTGKNSLMDVIGDMLGRYFLLADDVRYLASNFNGHFENNLLTVFDEAFWSGDKKMEGKLKGLITGRSHNIERKGHEPYQVDNVTRVVIIGNDSWLVPASHDERRFAVFTVGDARQGDVAYFTTMKRLMAAGGNRLLLRHLLDFDLAAIDIDRAPASSGLETQKLVSLSGQALWLFQSLQRGGLGCCKWEERKPLIVAKADARADYGVWQDSQRYGPGRRPNDVHFSRNLNSMLPKAVATKDIKNSDGLPAYKFASLAACREAFQKHLGTGSDIWEVD